MILGGSLLPLVVLHTGGRWGDNLNGWLLTALLGGVLVAAVGKLTEAVWVRRALRSAGNGSAFAAPKNGATGRNGAAARNGGFSRLHAVWLALHRLLVAALLVLLGWHVFSVYYF
jgi:hypothetical protein